MDPISAILDSLVLYRYSLVLALACAAGVCFFMACCSNRNVPSHRAAGCALTASILSLFFSRVIYWYSRPDQFSSFLQALTANSTEAFALAGVFAGCPLAVLLIGHKGSRKTMLDAMSVSGCFSMALGRLACFFTETNRGQMMTRLTSLPWAYPVANASGQLEYRFAVFLFQAMIAAALGIFLAVLFFRRKTRQGDITILFVLCYSASQVILDSTRYDSLYLRSNGFVSIVQVLSALALAAVLILLSIRAVRVHGLKKYLFLLWITLAALFGGTGYMEYYVQRHGREAAFAYTVMGIFLVSIVALGFLLWHLSRAAQTDK